MESAEVESSESWSLSLLEPPTLSFIIKSIDKSILEDGPMFGE